MKILRHIAIVAAAVIVFLGIPFLRSDTYKELTGKSAADTVSSASVIIEEPSGEYQIYINKDRHPDEENLATWIDFFEGKEISYLFEDIPCMVAKGDSLGLEAAKSLQSRLPENQMVIKEADPTLMLSKADQGRYDVIIISREMAEIYAADSVTGHEETIGVTLKSE